MQPRAVLFDLDGTLVHSLPGLTRATNALLAERGRPPLTAETVGSLLGHGARSLLVGAGRLTGGPFADDPYPRFIELCLDPSDIEPYPGIPALLDALADRPLAVITNKSEAPARALLEHLGWTERFIALIGADTRPTRKPDPEGLLHVAGLAGCRPEEAVYIGDSAVDMEVARRAGMPGVGVTWGYGDPAGGDVLVDSVAALTGVLGC